VAQTRGPGDVNFVAFGDSGYIPAYEQFDEDDDKIAKTPDEFIRQKIAVWLQDHNAIQDFAAPPMTFDAGRGSYVAASGLHQNAWAMTEYCRDQKCDFAIMLGDNIYPDGPTFGADGISDARRFTDMFDRPFSNLGDSAKDFVIYATLGNHDWHISREAAMSEVKYLTDHPKFHMDGLFYRVKPPSGGGQVELFVIDSQMLLASTTVYKDDLAADGSEIPTTKISKPDPWEKPRTESEKKMAQWLDDALRKSTAKWKIVMAHHPLWSSSGGKYAQARALRTLILPSLCKYADAYFAGHEHTLEVNTDSCKGIEGAKTQPLPTFVSGAASKQRPIHRPFMTYQKRINPQLETLYARGMVWGFMSVELSGETLTAQIVTTPSNGHGEVLPDQRFSFMRRSGP